MNIPGYVIVGSFLGNFMVCAYAVATSNHTLFSAPFFSMWTLGFIVAMSAIVNAMSQDGEREQ